MKAKSKHRAARRRNPVARALCRLRPKVKPSDKIYTRKRAADVALLDFMESAGGRAHRRCFENRWHRKVFGSNPRLSANRGRSMTAEQKAKHKAAMEKVLADVREYVADTKRVLATIKSPELRRAAIRD